ncbi:putative holin-like toxin [Pseudalkalibacillus berkeleyi]|uniref:Holin-like toxin n=1 Tax=Pseudalkalibacillus berkeleyi TaxID=1069813 RepID=A0ABS9GV19_9BACL|nr:putative holin-like toxin [Pseudalkalibacillus berkeleyi]MCF6136677.1 putative holin-like toxin [Pseudalkalibacillus berkeleyi]
MTPEKAIGLMLQFGMYTIGIITVTILIMNALN